ncbi:hypothetical protein ACQKFO_21165 [Rossellomorea sp. NPDC071047]|uniref:hypothetical protein n=1 Tax=Rossellomorea sp. NPDC071047 TaxID=3390675 RepID=UPI003D06E39D
MDIIIMLVIGAGLWTFYRIMTKEPILPWGEKKHKASTANVKGKKKKSMDFNEEEEPDLFRELFSDVKEITHHMIRFQNNKFVMLCEVDPCNYFLLSNEEQEQIDVAFETWLSQINYPVQFYLQNRYIDLSEPIDHMRKTMRDEDDLNENAYEYGNALLEELAKWQASSPRYETKRFLTFTYIVNEKDIKADDDEELEEKILDKAFSELYRRFNTAKNSLRKADMSVELLTNEGIAETLYCAFNRRKAVKNKFKDLGIQESLALYCTSEQSQSRIEAVKEMIENEEKRENDKLKEVG